jgi:tetratricopeptide (TPR) repeat protein
MAGRQYLLLINNVLKQHLLALGPKEKGRLKEKLDFLANGLWDAGVRIKKLKGLSRKVVFEARLSRSQRLLFTLGHSDGRAAVYLWGIAEHDEVNRKASRLLPENAPFLSFAADTQENREELEIDALPEAYYSQEDIEQKVPEDYGPQKWFLLSEDQWRRLLLSGSGDELETFLYLTREQAAILQSSPPTLISGTAGSGKTTLAVYTLLRREYLGGRRLFLTYSPFLKRFSERIYDGLTRNSELEAARPDFLTFGELLERILVSQAGGGRHPAAGLEEFRGIYRNHSLSRKYDPELVWEEIRSIIKGAKPMISLGRYRRLVEAFHRGELGRMELGELRGLLLGLRAFEFLPKIERAVELKTSFKDYEDFLARLEEGADPRSSLRDSALFLLQEILKAIEKRSSRLASPLLTLQEYTLLGRKRAPNFLYDRQDIYGIAEYYQQKLSEQGLLDEIDLCRRALELLSPPEERFQYDLVVCDEVQDFADIQLSLIFRLARPFWSVVLAGDPRQVINPSGFRWEEVKDRFFERGAPVPAVHNLSLNFRCVGSIVRISNALLELKQRLVGLSGGELREQWKYEGKPPSLIEGMGEEEVLRRVRLTGAGRIILTREVQEQEALKRRLATELVFTIYEAKGLEFDTVLLWKFLPDGKAAEIWRRVAGEQTFERSHHPHIRHELSLLYVAVTRARNTLLIYDGEKSSFVWEVEALGQWLHRTAEPEAVETLWARISTPEEWKAQGEYFFEREHFAAALECYKNAGEAELAQRAEGLMLFGKGRFAEAAPLLQKHGYAEQAAESLERAGELGRAAELWEQLGESHRAMLCRIRLHEQQGRFEHAAEEWEKLGETERALENWRKAKNPARIAEHHLASGSYEEAAREFERARDYPRAAASYARARKLEKAADLYFLASDWRSAAALYQKLKNTRKLLECYTNAGDTYAAALLYEKQRQLDQAVESFRRFASSGVANRQRLETEAEQYGKGRRALRAALRYSALEAPDRAAPLYERAKRYDRAVREYRLLGDHRRAAECLAAAGSYYEAAVEREQDPGPGGWDWIEEQLLNHVYRAPRGWYGRTADRVQANRLYEEAGRRVAEGAYESALVRYKVIGFPKGIVEAYRHLGRDEEALEFFLSRDLGDSALEYMDARGEELQVSLEWLRSKTLEKRPEFGRYRGEGRRNEVLVRLLRILTATQPEQSRPLAEQFLESFFYFSTFTSHAPSGLPELALEARLYNPIFAMAEGVHWMEKKLDKGEAGFFERVKQEGEVRSDRCLLACHQFLFDPDAYERSLAEIPLDRWNWRLFSRGAAHYRQAVSFLLQERESIPDAQEKAAQACRMNGDFAWAAKIHEQVGDLKLAAREYRDAKLLEEALRCFQALGDEPNVARMYERMGRFHEAERIWKKRSNKRDLARVRKKKLLEEQRRSGQRELF